MKFKKELFYSADEWLAKAHPELLDNAETHWLHTQARLAREALEKHLEVRMREMEDIGKGDNYV